MKCNIGIFAKSLVLFVYLGLTTTAHASSLDYRDLSKWKSSLNKLLPKDLRTWSELKLWPLSNDQSFCAAFKNAPYPYEDRNEHRDFLYINPNCLTKGDINEIKSHYFTKSNILESKVKKALIREIVKRELPFRLDNAKIRKMLFKNNFFQTPWTLGLDIKTSLKNATYYFYGLGIAHYLSDPNFYKKSPKAFKHIKENIFNNKLFFPIGKNFESLLEKDQYQNNGKVKLLIKGNETFWTRYHMIENAQKSIYISYFALFHDVYGLATLGHILEKMKQNPKLEVVILLDGRGTFKDHGSKHIKHLIYQGAKVKVYNPVFMNWAIPLRTFKVGFVDGIVSSNHDKILLVDDKYFTTGGRNIADKYYVESNELDTYVFRDADIFIEYEKPPITALKAIFTEYDTFFARDVWQGKSIDAEKEMFQALEAMRDRINNENLSQETIKKFPELKRHKSLYGYNKWSLDLSQESYVIKGYDNTSKLLNIDELTQKIYQLINEAKHEITIQNPYVVLTEEMLKRLEGADKRGVAITISTGSHVSSDSTLTINYLRDNWKKILSRMPHAKMYAYLGPEKSHSKIFIFDRRKTIIGSYNLDILSESINSEFAVVVESENFAREVEEEVKSVIDSSFEYSLEGNRGPHSIPGDYSRYVYRKNEEVHWDILGWISRPWL